MEFTSVWLAGKQTAGAEGWKGWPCSHLTLETHQFICNFSMFSSCFYGFLQCSAHFSSCGGYFYCLPPRPRPSTQIHNKYFSVVVASLFWYGGHLFMHFPHTWILLPSSIFRDGNGRKNGWICIVWMHVCVCLSVYVSVCRLIGTIGMTRHLGF